MQYIRCSNMIVYMYISLPVVLPAQLEVVQHDRHLRAGHSEYDVHE